MLLKVGLALTNCMLYPVCDARGACCYFLCLGLSKVAHLLWVGREDSKFRRATKVTLSKNVHAAIGWFTLSGSFMHNDHVRLVAGLNGGRMA